MTSIAAVVSLAIRMNQSIHVIFALVIPGMRIRRNQYLSNWQVIINKESIMSGLLMVICCVVCFIFGCLVSIAITFTKKVGYMEITETETKMNYNLIVTVPIDDLGKYKVVAFIVKKTPTNIET